MIDGVVNMRDLGGMRTVDGRAVRSGVVYRSGNLHRLTRPVQGGDTEVSGTEGGDTGVSGTEGGDTEGGDTAGGQALVDLGIRTVFDLRTVSEVTGSPDRLGPGIEVLHLDVLADATESIAAHLAEIFADPTSAERVFSPGVIDRHYVQTYRNLVLLGSARDAYQRLFTRMAATEHAVLFHCTAGKDRTGWAAASLLTLLGVDRSTVTEDYLWSNDAVLAAFGPYMQQFADMGGEPKLLEPAFLVTADYLDAAFGAVEEHYGSIEDYFETALGVDAGVRESLRERLLV